MATPARASFGLSTAARGTNLGNYGAPDPTKWHTYFGDFDTYTAGQWTITAVGAGTTALTDADGGAILLTNAGADNDSRFHQKVGEGFLLAAGKRFVFKSRFKISDATQSDFIMGLQITDTTPLAAGGDGATDGVFFQKDDGAATFDFYCMKDTTTGQISKTAVGSVVADTYIRLGFEFDGKTKINLYVDDFLTSTVDLTTTPATYLPDTELTISFGIQNGEAAAKTMTVDYIFAAQER